MKFMKRIISALLSISIMTGITASSVPVSAADNDDKTVSISNDFMTFSVNEETGFFGISTLDGHPQKAADNNMNLLYDGDSIETSFTTVRVDGKDYIFGQDYGIFGIEAKRGTSTVDAVNNCITTEWTIKGLTITQKAYLSRTNNVLTTGNVSLAYNVKNTTGTEHEVGIRVMLDNSLGDIDAPEVYVQNEASPISKETRFFEGGIEPGSYIRFTNGDNFESKEAYINFDDTLCDIPDSMVVGHWYNLASSKWKFEPDSDMAFSAGFNSYGTADTATALYWNETKVSAGSDFTRTMLYGIGDFTYGGQQGNFNLTLEIDDSELVYETGSEVFKNNIAKAHVTIYNNVDGSTDINSATLCLTCEDGAFFVHDKNDEGIMGVQTYYENLGFIKAGAVETYDCEIAVSIPDELKAIKVMVGLEGNNDTDKAQATQFIIASAPNGAKPSFAATEISQTKYHIEGNRVFLLKGIFDLDLLEDRTKWAAALVSRTDPSLRYEIHSDNITLTSESTMSLMYGGKMAEGEYNVEFSFFDDYTALFGKTYIGPGIVVVNDPQYMMSRFSTLGVVRMNNDQNSTYDILAASDITELKGKVKASGAKELLLIVKGDFQMDADENGKITGYTALGDFTVNDVVVGEKGSRVEFVTSGEGEGVRVAGKNAAYSAAKNLCLLNCDWQIKCPNGFKKSLLDGSLSLEVNNDFMTSAAMEIALGIFNAKFGVLGKKTNDDGTDNYVISYGGSISFIGYSPKAQQKEAEKEHPYLTRGYTGLSLSAAIDDVMFDKDGFVGINTTVKAAFVACNILGCAQQDAFSLSVTVNTIDNIYSATGQITLKGTMLSLGLGFKEARFSKDKSMVIPDYVMGRLAVPPTEAVPIVPGILGLYTMGLDLRGLADTVTLASYYESAEDMRKAANAATTNIAFTLGLTLFEVVTLTGTASLGTNHIYLSVTGGLFKAIGISVTLALKSSWQYAVHDDNGNMVTPSVGSISASGDINVLDIIKGGIGASWTYKGLNVDDFLAKNTFAFTFYGGVYLPKAIPILGGMELLGVDGRVDTIGVTANFVLVGVDIGLTYGWESGEFNWVSLSSADEDGKVLGINNMRYIPVTSYSDVSSYKDTNPYKLMSAGSHLAGEFVSDSKYSTMLCVKYMGEKPDVSDLSLTLDSAEYTLEGADERNQNGNCVVVADSEDEGRILIGLPNIESGRHSYRLESTSDTRLVTLEAAEFTKPASAKTIINNADGTVTINADRSLKGSTIELYCVKDKDAYNDIKTEEYIDEDGNTKVRAYKMADGEKIIYGEEFFEKFKQHCVAAETVETDAESVTLTPQFDASINSGDYYMMAVVHSPLGKNTRCVTAETVSYTNPHQPVSIDGVSVENAGNERLRVIIDEAENADYTGYFISLYNDTDNVEVVEPTYVKKGEDILIENACEAGKKYHAKAVSANVFSADEFALSVDERVSGSVEVLEAENVNVSIELENETANGKFKGTDGTQIDLPYVKSDEVIVKGHSETEVKGRFILDGEKTEQSADKNTEFTEKFTKLASGKHTLIFEAENDRGDTTVSEPVTFAVSSGAPSVMLENGAVKIVNDTVTLRGTAMAADKIIFSGSEFPVNSDGTFEVTGKVETDRFAQRQTITAVGYDGQETVISFLAVNSSVEKIDSIIIKADNEDVDKVNVKPGDRISFAAFGVSGGHETDMGNAANIMIYDGNSLASLDSGNVLSAQAPGKVYVKAVYDMGTRVNEDGTSTDYKLEDMIEVNIMRELPKPQPSIPDGANTKTSSKLKITGTGDIYYTTDGSEPTASSSKYTSPITLPLGDVTVKAKAIKDGYLDSETAVWTYKVTKSTGSGRGSSSGGALSSPSPTDTPQSGSDKPITSSVDNGKEVDSGYPLELGTNIKDGVIYYTTDGSTPNKNSEKYEKPIVINSSTLVRAVVWTEGDVYSDVADYDIKVREYGIYLKKDMEKGGFISGFEDGTFRPDENLTRAQNAAILRRATEMYGYYIDENRFPDVDMWAKDYINELAAAGVVSGYEDGVFRPDNNVTRAEFVTMLMRVIDEKGDEAPFTDTKGHWAEKYIAKAAEYGYLSGYEDGTFRPDGEITRAEAVVIMSKVFSFDAGGTVSDFSDLAPNHWAFGYIAK